MLIYNNPCTPGLVFDPNNETLNTTPDMEYSTDGGKTWKPCPSPMDVSDLDGKEILVRYPGGDAITVKIPARRMAPAVDHTDETQQGRNDGTLTKTDKTMEYRLLPDGKWTAIAGNTVKGLTPGTYEVRYAATSTDMASKVQPVVIAKGASSNGSDNDGNNSDLNMSGSKLSLLNRKDHIAYIAGRTSTQAAPNADITRAEVAAILYRLLTLEAKAAYETSVSRFKDVSANDWYGTAVSTLTNLGVIAGYQDGSFGPQRNITRAELATILARFCGTVKDSAKDRFSDISGSWARKYINLAAEAGLVYGYTDGTFRPDQNITRAETIVMVNRILGRSASSTTVLNGYKTFSDVTPDAWYYWDIVEASNLHTFHMDGSAEKWTALG